MTQDGHEEESEMSLVSGFKEASSIFNLKNTAIFT